MTLARKMRSCIRSWINEWDLKRLYPGAEVNLERCVDHKQFSRRSYDRRAWHSRRRFIRVDLMPDPLRLRVQRLPERLVVVRLGATTLADTWLAEACERSYDRWGLWGFSVLEVPNGDDYTQLVRLRPEVGQRRQLLVAEGRVLAGDGFPLLATLDHPHWTVVMAQPSVELFDRVRRHFQGPVPNPGWVA